VKSGTVFRRGRLVDRKVVRCAGHGDSAFCWIQDDGKHIDDSLCRCLTGSPSNCPIDVHRSDMEVRDKLLELVKKGGKK
jgi:hypothetical protein